MSRHLRFVLPVVVAAGCLLVGPTWVGTAQAKEPQKQSNSQLKLAIAALDSAKTTLQKANHDYGGHRVKAIKAINAARTQLTAALKFETGKGKVGAKPGKDGKGGENQGVSNSQLAQSIAVLRETKVVLEGANHDYGGHRVKAIKAINTAIDQLQTALKYEKGKGGRKRG
jgi:hypothetical protein